MQCRKQPRQLFAMPSRATSNAMHKAAAAAQNPSLKILIERSYGCSTGAADGEGDKLVFLHFHTSLCISPMLKPVDVA